MEIRCDGLVVTQHRRRLDQPESQHRPDILDVLRVVTLGFG
jgi:hypothetical protein